MYVQYVHSGPFQTQTLDPQNSVEIYHPTKIFSLGGVACSAFPFVAIVDFRDPTPRAGPSNQATSSGLLR